MNKKINRISLIVECDVLLESELKTRENYEKEFDDNITDEELRRRMLFAFLNPKIDALNDDDAIDGVWDNICEFKGKLKNFQLKLFE